MSREQYYSIGILPEQYKVIICKGTVSPRAAYEPVAREIIVANSPGVTSAEMASFSYQHRRKPFYPAFSSAGRRFDLHRLVNLSSSTLSNRI